MIKKLFGELDCSYKLMELYNLLYQRRYRFNMEIIILEHFPVKGRVSSVISC